MNETAWRTDDYWRYALFAAVAVIRACAVILGISEAELAERLAELDGLEVPWTNVQSRPRMWPIAAGQLRVELLSHGEIRPR